MLKTTAQVADLHAHYVSRSLIAEVDRNGDRYGVRVATDEHGKVQLNFVDGPPVRAFYDELFELRERHIRLDVAGIDVQVLSSWADIAGYHLPARQATAWCRLQNETLAEAAADEGARFAAMGCLPLQDVPIALQELRFAADTLGMQAFQVCTNVNGRDLDDPEFRPIWELAAERDVLIFLHPPNRNVAPERLGDYFLNNLIGNPVETSIAGARLICSGLFQDFPTVKVLLAHGGGMLPYQIGRLDQGYLANPATSVRLRSKPSSFLGSFYYDTVLFNELALEHLFRIVPSDHIVFGSDCPFPIRDDHMLERLRGLRGVDATSLEQVLVGNARRLFPDVKQSHAKPAPADNQ